MDLYGMILIFVWIILSYLSQKTASFMFHQLCYDNKFTVW